MGHLEAGMKYPTVIVEEGDSRVIVPKLMPRKGEPLQRARSRAPVFYNPRMKLNRDSAVLAVGALRNLLSRDFMICEPLCGSGVRGIRLALEVEGVESAVLGDLSPEAVRFARQNVRINGVADLVRVRLMGANLLLSLHAAPFSRFDYIDIDPYGTPAPFIDSAVRASRRDGMVALTATDMAPLYGVNPRSCLRKYGSWPLKTEYAHESALRILAASFVRRAAVHELSTRPVFGFYADHYIRLYMMFDSGKSKANDSLNRLGYMLHCSKCLSRKGVYGIHEGIEICDACGSPMEAAGPLWLGNLADSSFCDEMIRLANTSFIGSNQRFMEILDRVKGEIGLPPGFIDLDKTCSRLGISSASLDSVLEGLREAGFDAARSHADDRGLKTDASFEELEGIVLGLHESNSDDSLERKVDG